MNLIHEGDGSKLMGHITQLLQRTYRPWGETTGHSEERDMSQISISVHQAEQHDLRSKVLFLMLAEKMNFPQCLDYLGSLRA